MWETGGRTKVHRVTQIKEILDVQYRSEGKVTLVMDNLNTHTGASLYEVFGPHETRRLLARLEVHYTPKHCGCRNMAEIDLGVFTRQCPNRRIPGKATLSAAVKVDWRFTTIKGRIKLKRFYPTLTERQNTGFLFDDIHESPGNLGNQAIREPVAS